MHKFVPLKTYSHLQNLFTVYTFQLTFTPAWGKRSASQSNNDGPSANDGLGNGIGGNPGYLSGGADGGGIGCRSNSDSLVLIHHIIQLEAQKLLQCHAKEAGGF